MSQGNGSHVPGDLSRDPSEREALEACAEITRRSGSNFYPAFLPLRPDRRTGMFCVYAYCRVIDDLVDEAQPGTDPRPELDRWRERVRQVAAGASLAGDHPVAVGLAATHRAFPMREDDLLALIAGMEMDLVAHRYATREDLSVYCERVAGRVGCLCLPVFGADPEKSRPHALALGEAFQLTNILRDVSRDAALGRVYLPQEDLERFRVREEDLAAGRRTPAVHELLAATSERALRLFDEAEALIPARDRASLFPASIMASIYRRILEEIRARDHDVFSERVSLPRGVKALLAGGVLLRDRYLDLW